MINIPKTSCDIHDINQNILSIKSFLTSLYLVVLLMHSSYVLCSQKTQSLKTEIQQTKKQLQIASNDTSTISLVDNNIIEQQYENSNTDIYNEELELLDIPKEKTSKDILKLRNINDKA